MLKLIPLLTKAFATAHRYIAEHKIDEALKILGVIL